MVFNLVFFLPSRGQSYLRSMLSDVPSGVTLSKVTTGRQAGNRLLHVEVSVQIALGS
jgi:hypothetical protein